MSEKNYETFEIHRYINTAWSHKPEFFAGGVVIVNIFLQQGV